ncbi:hypothetical protein HZC07_02920 [Candidatus Micrarchaeota archaeon]|nr:hypothetical protein [Candidatus Micrarchaeota archaeon]
MTELKRSIKCSSCGGEATVYVSSDLELKEMIIAGKCRCGSSMQINYNLVGSDSSQSNISGSNSATSNSEQQSINLDESLFSPTPAELPSDAIRDLLED